MNDPIVNNIEEPIKEKNKLLNILRWIDKWIIEGFEKIIVSFGLILLSAIVFFTVVTRYLFGFSPNWSDELPRFLVIWITFVGMSYCVRKGEHVVIDVLFNKVPEKFKKYFYLVILLICFIFFAFIFILGCHLTSKIFISNQKSVTLGISMAYVYMAIPVGSFLAAVNFLHLIVKNIFSKSIHTSLTEGGESK